MMKDPKEEKIRILFLIDHIDGPGGTEKHLACLARSLDKNTFDCSIVVFNLIANPLVDEVVQSGIAVHHIPVGRYYTLHALRKALVLSRLIKKRKVDIVQTYHYKANVYGSLVAWLSGVECIIASKRDVADQKTAFNFRLYRLVRGITRRYIVVSDQVGAVVREKERVNAEKIVRIYNGVDTQQYDVPSAEEKRAARARIGLQEGDFVIGMVAWFRPEKDHGLILRAFKQVLREVERAKLVLVGGGPLLEACKRRVLDDGISSSVLLPGPVEDVIPYLNSLDIACLIPRTNEGFSNSVLEKMAKGIPVIVTDVGGNKEAVVHNETGFVIQPGDLVGLVRYVRLLVGDPGLRTRLGQNARRRVEEHFRLGEMIRKHEDLYLSLVARRRGGNGP